MTRGLFDYPPKAAFGRVLPKSKVYAFGKVTRRLRDRFATEVEKITWRFKLAPETINLAGGSGVAEIQVFGIDLKPGIKEADEAILRCIDNAIASPILFEVTAFPHTGSRIQVIAAYKRDSESDSSKSGVGDYFRTEWFPVDSPRMPLPIALNLSGLYEQLLRQLIPLAARPSESVAALVERHRAVEVKRREVAKLEAQLNRVQQFNRKVEINAQLRTARTEFKTLAD